MSIRVAVADDQPLVRTGLCGILATAEDLVVVGEASTGRQAIEVVRSQRPDVILMDIRMPDVDGLEATRIIGADSSTKVLVLTTFDLDDYVYEALRAGASGFLLKDTPPHQLLEAIRVVAGGDALLAPAITKRLIAEFAARPDKPIIATHSQLAAITDREREVLSLVAEGLSNAEIAAQLHIGPGTAKTHVAHLLTKLNARDRVQLAIIAHRSGW